MDKISYHFCQTYKTERKILHETEKLLYELKDKYSIPDERFYNLMIAVTEAVNNAIIHGNKNDPAKEIRLTVDIDDTNLTFTIEDQGRGFEPECIEDPRSPENLLKASGRGVFLIKTLMDDVKYKITRNGTKLIIKYYLQSQP